MATTKGHRTGLDDQQFIDLFERYGASRLAALTGTTDRGISIRRQRLEQKLGRKILGPASPPDSRVADYPRRLETEIQNGVAIVGSDAHFWPGLRSTAFRALLKLTEQFKTDGSLQAVVLNGDSFDGARVSRHPPIGWAKPPTVKEELDAMESALTEIETAAGSVLLFHTIGNHDSRFESRLAAQAPEYDGVPGFMLKDHFPKWTWTWSLWVNSDVVIKHRFKGGVHATHNNTVNSGKTMVTGHLHSLKVTPFSDYNGTRYGADTGTLADPYGEQFDYAEDNPLNHRSGFVVLTFANGQLLPPELVIVLDTTHVVFRGQVIEV